MATILFVLTPALHPNRGGVQMTTCKLAAEFLARGHVVEVFSFAVDGHEPPPGPRLHRAPLPGGQGEARNLAALASVLKQVGPDIVINQMPYEHAISRTLADHARCPLVGCLRNTLYSVRANLDAYGERVLPRWLSPALRNAAGRSLLLANHRRRHRRDLQQILATYDRFVMFGPPNLEELAYFVPDFDRERIRLIPNSVPAVCEAVPEKERRILWLGRVETRQKRAELVPEIWRRVCPRLPEWELDVVGEGPALERVRARCRRLGLRGVHFHGRQVPDDFYRRAAVYFMTSAFEGFPNTLVEAQSYGAVPVVFDSYPVASWIVEQAAGGFLVDPFDVDAMASRIVDVALDPDRARLAEGALCSARRFHISRVGEHWQALLDEFAPGSRQAAVA